MLGDWEDVMEHKQAGDFDQELLNIFYLYVYGHIDRRGFLVRAARFAVGGMTAGWPAYETALKANNIRYTMYKYPGTQHGFNNDTTPRYDEAAAKLAWQRTIDFFNKEVRGA